MILITGATGFLGHNLCEYLAGRGALMRALVRPTSDYAFLEELGIELAWGDLNDAEAVARACEGCQEVVHAGAKFRLWGPWEEFYRTNVMGTHHILEAACQAKVRRFIYVSTVAVIGRPVPGRIIDEEHPCAPLDHYQYTKLMCERLALRYHDQRGLPVIVIRPGAFYGPWGHYGLNRLLFDDFLRGIRIQVHHGRHITFPVYVKDVCWAIETLLERGRLGETYNVSGESIPHRQASDIISRLAGKSTWRFNAPEGLMVTVARVLEILARFTRREPWYPLNLYPYIFYDWPVSSEKARRELGFQPTPFEDGARETLDWYRANGIPSSLFCSIASALRRIPPGLASRLRSPIR